MDGRAWRRFRKNRGALVGLAIVIALLLFSFVSPILTSHDPYIPDFDLGRGPYGSPLGPNSRHWLGTDTIFRDVFVRLAQGGRLSLEVAFVATLIAIGVGTAIGVISGYFKGATVRVDSLLDGAVIADGLFGALVIASGSAVLGWRVIGFGMYVALAALALRIVARVLAIVRGAMKELSLDDLVDTFFGFVVSSSLAIRGHGLLADHRFASGLIAVSAILFLIRVQRRAPSSATPLTIDFDDAVMRAIDVLLAFPFLLLLMAISAVVDRTTIVTIFLVLGLTYWTGIARVVRAKTLQIRELDYILAARALGQSTPSILTRHVLPNVGGVTIILATNSIAAMIVAEAALAFLGLSVAPPAPSWGRMLDEGRPYYSAAPWLLVAPAIAILLAVLGFNLLGEGLRDAFDSEEK